MYCTTDQCLSVDKLKKEKKKECQCTEVSVCVVYILSTMLKMRILTCLLAEASTSCPAGALDI